MLSSQEIARHSIALFFGFAIAICVGSGVGLFFPRLGTPVILLLSGIWLAAGVFVIAREIRNRGADVGVLENSRQWRSDTLPSEFRFITRDTTVRKIVEKIGPCTRARGSGSICALEYDLPYGAAVLIFPEPPFDAMSKVRGVQFYTDRNKIPLSQ